MQTTKPLFGASRLPLTTKRANKDFYKGTRQAFIPGTSVRTGRPGTFQSRGDVRFTIDDSKVRVFVPPPAELYRPLEATNQHLKPYVAGQINARAMKQTLQDIHPLPSFGPIPTSLSKIRKSPEGKAKLEALKVENPKAYERITNHVKRKIDFTREYRALPPAEKEALKMQARREWFEAWQRRSALIKEQKFGDGAAE